jgi:histidine triad (HIT) family protein
MSEPSIFTRILNGDIPGEIVDQTERAFAIRDINPQAPTHLLVIPKTEQYRNVVELAAGDPTLMAELVELAERVAAEHANGDFRLIFNNGATVGQTVFHVHGHVVGNLEEGALVGF